MDQVRWIACNSASLESKPGSAPKAEGEKGAVLMRCDVMICLRDFCSRFLLERSGSYLAQVQCPNFEAAVRSIGIYTHGVKRREDFSRNGILITPIKLVAHRLDQHVACILIILSHLGVLWLS